MTEPERSRAALQRSLGALRAAGRRRIAVSLLIGALVVGLGVAGFRIVHELRTHVSTDDAFVEGTMIYVASRVPGQIVAVDVREHQRVHAGELLVRLDPSGYETRVAKAEADLAAAKNRVAGAEAQAASADAEQRAAKAERWRTEREAKRIATLFRRGAASRQQLDQATAARDAAVAQVRALGLKADAARAVLGNQAPIEQAKAALDSAKLDLAHTQITAPFDGVVGRKNVDPGAIVSAGQPLLALTADQPSWVMANFKETAIARMRVGDPAEVHVDAFPDRVWYGHVDSFSPATGAEYALLPSEPAAGNFTKVVQRVPVKIVLDRVSDGKAAKADPGGAGPDFPRTLPVGLSCEVSVRVR